MPLNAPLGGQACVVRLPPCQWHSSRTCSLASTTSTRMRSSSSRRRSVGQPGWWSRRTRSPAGPAPSFRITAISALSGLRALVLKALVFGAGCACSANACSMPVPESPAPAGSPVQRHQHVDGLSRRRSKPVLGAAANVARALRAQPRDRWPRAGWASTAAGSSACNTSHHHRVEWRRY